MDYNDYGTGGLLAFWLLLVPIFFVFGIAFYILGSWFLMKIFDKAGVQGRWRAWVPVYNTMVFTKLGDLNPWLILIAWGAAAVLSWIPLIGWIIGLLPLIVSVLAAWRVGLKLQKEAVWVILYFFLSLVWLGILGFDKSRWNNAVPPAPWAGNGFLGDRTNWAGIPAQTAVGGYAAAPPYGAPGAYPPPAPGTQPPAGYAAPPAGYAPPPAGYTQPPAGGYAPPPAGYTQPPAAAPEPPAGYTPPPAASAPEPPAGYTPPPAAAAAPAAASAPEPPAAPEPSAAPSEPIAPEEPASPEPPSTPPAEPAPPVTPEPAPPVTPEPAPPVTPEPPVSPEPPATPEPQADGPAIDFGSPSEPKPEDPDATKA
ncbi:hypothetical protein ACH3VR_11030 [Microbacterium sp. B2969]|uniref:Large exoprotein n=1 Tax=Microbacterium alkaliflavum TaxID=3248839 RepID=A0ABW7QBM5_9MICO